MTMRFAFCLKSDEVIYELENPKREEFEEHCCFSILLSDDNFKGIHSNEMKRRLAFVDKVEKGNHGL